MHPYTGRVPATSPKVSQRAVHHARHVTDTSLGHQSFSSAQRSDSHAFSVLRSDPLNPSLVHVASTTSLPSRGVNASGRSPQLTSNGSSPPFRVAPSSSVPMYDYPSTNLDRHRRSTVSGVLGRPREIEIPRKSVTPPAPYPAIILFPMAGAGEAASADDIGDDASDGDNSPSESNTGKKHVCSICQKRFNRPSSLRIHLNTHTGATRKYIKF